MDERAWVAALRNMTRGGPGVIQGIGDDCAILASPGDGPDLLVSTDMFIEGVHFDFGKFTARQAGYRAVARALSDIAAMGGEPRWHLMSTAWGVETQERWALEFMRGAAEAADEFQSALVGGDTSRTNLFTCDVTVIGTVPHGEALPRSGAKPGDGIYVSGLLGGSEYGRRKGPDFPAGWTRHARPQPRLALGQWLRGKASACMDLSDGLSLDLHRLCLASGVAAEIGSKLPLWPGVTHAEAWRDGEDYELLFTAPAAVEIPPSWEGLALTRIGEIATGPVSEVYLDGKPARIAGYDHLADRP